MRKLVFAAVLPLTLTACASMVDRPTTASALPDETPAQLYAAALYEAAIPKPSTIGPGLLRIAPDNPKLSWRNGPDGKQVLVASVMSSYAYDRYYRGQPTGGPTGWGQIWVTAVPQLKEFCTEVPGDAAAKTLRVVQWLGLNPASPYAQVVELWIEPEQLVRPCPITDITAATCTLDTADQSGPPAVKGTTTRPICAPGDAPCAEKQSYWDWFATNMRLNLKEGGAPWTRLGYTFDWKPAKDGGFVRYGGSEFVMKPGAKYQVHAAYTLAEYCAAPGS
ncbi:hypothetical protein CHU95_18930 [Niveispirillum lacus]|uniref:Lipoprotein n=1 Tax=Niveispirillum lacus TaxID=1981099 RepID=A0A255YUF4_9PROT|nr:hypothetical protein [Niveispirillum lacus]OYQ32821.1 hypothetical protein CHU95_18930 [Niveispirillum lacus]